MSREKHTFVGDIHLPEAVIGKSLKIAHHAVAMRHRVGHEFTHELILDGEQRNIYGEAVKSTGKAVDLLTGKLTVADVLADESGFPSILLAAVCQVEDGDLPQDFPLSRAAAVVLELLQADIDLQRDYLFKNVHTMAMQAVAAEHGINIESLDYGQAAVALIKAGQHVAVLSKLNDLELEAIAEQVKPLRILDKSGG